MTFGVRKPFRLVFAHHKRDYLPSFQSKQRNFVNTLKRVNPSFKSYEAISKAIVVKEMWSVENNMLTPTMKIKRNIVEKHYHDKIEQWAELDEDVVFE